ncbi:DEAD-box ATP-dependent RNA helicase 37-like protein [Corchorus olitorius]|uniref:DEAD-box ATP-dependent RNA helicase 37-like protein n=1 Tax=Corchorus olitorius TaxID=93759 RepID=A0A1R3IZ67_9ROSI|nr:DEAD-box ATP-dependent RNA helicase 37-like protein [Corchorus olitorius]
MAFMPQITKTVEQMDMHPPGVREIMLSSDTFPKQIQATESGELRLRIIKGKQRRNTITRERSKRRRNHGLHHLSHTCSGPDLFEDAGPYACGCE